MSPAYELVEFQWLPPYFGPRQGDRVLTIRKSLPGLALALALATIATLLGHALPAVGAPILALGAGALFGAVWRRSVEEAGVLAPGLRIARQRLLALAIVLLGLGLPLPALLAVGHRTSAVLLGTLLVCAVTAVLIGRMLALERDSAILVAAGTAICGASAIAAVAAVLRPERERLAYALGTIFVFNIAAVLVFPPLGSALGLSEQSFGLWAGTAINDTSSVVAAGVIFGPAAAQFAVTVKMVRSLLIVPLCLGVHLTVRRSERAAAPWRAVPVFVALFVVASVLASTGLIPTVWAAALGSVSAWLIAAALAAIGTSLSWSHIRIGGGRPLLFGGILAVVLSVSCLILQWATGWL
ncbi:MULTISPECIES: YeiH family protein [unclassified Nocardia]|uniref:YeiH family protein n=1 Tax=unclassified Nocardia TaxID=2637762 RepID=UPI00278C2253|nr:MULTISPECIES: putative sulfate exporter family transporter [unclassified Nocardia]